MKEVIEKDDTKYKVIIIHESNGGYESYIPWLTRTDFTIEEDVGILEAFYGEDSVGLGTFQDKFLEVHGGDILANVYSVRDVESDADYEVLAKYL